MFIHGFPDGHPALYLLVDIHEYGLEADIVLLFGQ